MDETSDILCSKKRTNDMTSDILYSNFIEALKRTNNNTVLTTGIANNRFVAELSLRDEWCLWWMRFERIKNSQFWPSLYITQIVENRDSDNVKMVRYLYTVGSIRRAELITVLENHILNDMVPDEFYSY